MRIHRLEIQAFGPFAGREVVDFDQLSAQGLFLLNGSTGAGKSSVLDAICYALYGQVPGARQGSGAALRSHHAEQGVGPEVLCEFSAGGRRLEVQRSPEWMRPVKRGSGTTREQAKTQVREKTAAGWEVKSTRNDEAAAEIQGLLGMNMAQFTKVVLLAQGEFAAFLRATAEERQILLQKLFGTDIYKDMELRLSADAKVAQAEVAAGLAQLSATEHIARSHAARHLDGAAKEQVQELQGTELFSYLRSTLEELVSRAQLSAKESQQHADTLLSEFQQARARRDRHEILVLAQAEEQRLAELSHTAQQWRTDQDQHHQAQVLAPVLATAQKAAEAVQLAVTQVERQTQSVKDNALAAHLVDDAGVVNERDLEQFDRSLLTQLAEVDGALPEETRHASKVQELSANQQALEEAQELASQQQAAAETAELRLAQIQQSQEELRQSGHNVAHAQQQAEQARTLLTTIAAYQQQHAAVKQLSESEARAREKFLAAKEKWLEAFDARLSQAAGELASELVDGEPCLVCGSPTHPAPSPLAGSGAALVSAEKAAKKILESAESAADQARTALDEARNLLTVLSERGGKADPDQAQAAVELHEQALAEANESVAALTALTVEAEQLRSAVSVSQREVVTATARAASLEASNAALTQEIAALDSRLEEARHGFASLRMRREALHDTQEPVSELLQALRQRATAQSAHDEAQTALELAVAQSPFANAEAVLQALLTPEQAQALDELLNDFSQALAINADRLKAPEVVAALAEVAAHIAAPTEQALAVQSDAVQAALQLARDQELTWGMLRDAAEQIGVTEASYAHDDLAVAPLRERAELLTGLAEAVRGGGDNKLKMTLSSYVLAARLEQVAEAASERLATMSDARYTLRHSDATSGNRKSGLGLVVVDEWTGASRDTASLSGGESFMASLSLALGLSDVVQHESGGLDIETLFVDEGFGSLDEQSLEQVMDALEGLRDGGRMVGLVSHVAEMKQRIPIHLQVHKGRHGSTLELTSAGVGLS